MTAADTGETVCSPRYLEIQTEENFDRYSYFQNNFHGRIAQAHLSVALKT